jgi:hypothetical protein
LSATLLTWPSALLKKLRATWLFNKQRHLF